MNKIWICYKILCYYLIFFNNLYKVYVISLPIDPYCFIIEFYKELNVCCWNGPEMLLLFLLCGYASQVTSLSSLIWDCFCSLVTACSLQLLSISVPCLLFLFPADCFSFLLTVCVCSLSCLIVSAGFIKEPLGCLTKDHTRYAKRNNRIC